jgi:hypothetical protein
MNRRLIALALVAPITTALVAGCSAAPDGTEALGSSEETLRKGGNGDPGGDGNPQPICGGRQYLDGNPFERGLQAFGCSPKQFYQAAGADNAWFMTWCPPLQPSPDLSVTWCPNGRPPATHLSAYIDCWGGVAPYLPKFNFVAPECGYIISNEEQINFDPRCHGGECSISTVDQ